jgi:diguanylate cyclase (GGDEF)-like protein
MFRFTNYQHMKVYGGSVAAPFFFTASGGETMTEPAPRTAGAIEPNALRVLVFEDNAMDAALMKKFLQTTGVRPAHIYHADTIPSALQIIARERVHVCLADYFLRPHTGFDLMDEARRFDLDVPFIVVSALDDRSVDEGARAHGAYAFLVKADLTVEGLERSIRYALTHHARESALSRTVYLDPLTRLPNRQAFLDRLTQTVADNSARKGMVGVAVFDLNGMRHLNEVFGYKAADDVLCAAARRLAAARHPCDIVARVGGDEFAVIMTDFLLAQQALARAQRLVDAAAGPVETEAGVHVVTMAGGVASQAVDLQKPAIAAAERLFEQAGQALRTAKRGTSGGSVSNLAFAHLH